MLEHYSYLGSFAASIEGDGNSATRRYLDELFTKRWTMFSVRPT
ncbi:hypothetical protein HMPREF3227_01620 [Corynebacterium sp. CMW7794]|nr:hypothetical protein HMPREF3227_01620 [Corynebacterium sp. CMW7794]